MGVYRLLLRLLPASFRAEYGEEMCAVFAARRRQENALGVWTAAVFDILTNAVRVHADLLRQDLAWTVRTLRQSPGFAGTAVLVAALGIGATTAAFTLLDHVLLRPLPFPDPDRLVVLCQSSAAQGLPCFQTSPPNFLDWRRMTRSFETVGAYTAFPVNLAGEGEPQRLDGFAVTPDVFEALGVQPEAGRGFPDGADATSAGAPATAMLGDALARTLYGDPARAVGETIRLNDQPYTIAGVMPAAFHFPARGTQVWLNLRFGPRELEERDNLYLLALARMRPGVTVEQARAEIAGVGAQLERAYPRENKGLSATAVALHALIAPQSRVMVWAVFAAAACLLLIACTNLANLLLARAMARRREIAVRAAIGAGRERLVRQLLTENMVLAAAGGACGLLLTLLAMPTLGLLVPESLPLGGPLELDGRVFAFAAVVALGTNVIFGVGPALRASVADMNDLRARGGAGRPAERLRSALVLAEVAGTVTLLLGGGLLMKALWRVQNVDPGFHAEQVLTLRTDLPMPKYATSTPRRRFYGQVLTEARALPGVLSAAYTGFLPMVFGGGIFDATIPGVSTDVAPEVKSSIRFITPDYFSTIGIPLRRGRDIAESDDWNAPFVTVISESLARRLWPGEDPIGQRVNIAFWDRTVVGVVGDVAVRGLEQTSEPQIYLPYDQVPNNGLTYHMPKDLLVRTRSDAEARALAGPLREIVRRADADQAVSDVRLLADIVAGETAPRRTQLRVLWSIAGIAMLLAAVGIHGLLSFAASARTQEVGVRLALGARPGAILAMFLRQGLGLGLAGIALAMPLAYLAAGSLQALLFGVNPADPVIYIAAAGLALAMTLAGSLRPALRAAGVDPAVTIRAE